MSLGRTVVAVSIDHDRLFALAATAGGDRVDVKSWIAAQMPATVDRRDGGQVGAWLGKQLRDAGLGRARIIFAVTRSEVILKKLRLPRPEAGEADLAGMVRLQMSRQLTLALEGTAIDYVQMGEVVGSGDAGGGQIAVLAGALPGDRAAWYRDVAKAAGCRIERIGLLASGAAAILASVSQRHSGPVLGIVSGPVSMEFVVVQDGHLVFARAAELGIEAPPADPAEARAYIAQRAAIEAKRTWMSYRVGQDSAEIDAVVVPGEGEIAREIGRRCGEALEMQWRLAVPPENVKFPENMPEEQRLTAAPLAGLLGERVLAKPTLDFAHPRKAPDRAAQRRQRALLAALVLLGVGGGGWLVATMELRSLQQRLDRAIEQGAELRRDQQAHLREQARLGHLRLWREAGVDWIAHAGWISEQMPDPQQARLDNLVGRLGANVTLTTRPGGYDHAGWQLEQAATLTISGRTRDRELVNQLRNGLVSSPVYTRVDTRGADVPDSFALNLITVHRSPADAKKASPEAKPEPPPAEGTQVGRADRARGGGE
jgi:hypothetical protein